MADYEALHYDKEKLREASVPLGIIVVDTDADLEQVRKHINQLHEDLIKSSGNAAPQLSMKWCFVDSTTAERFFRIDRAQEHLHYVTDISSEDLYILDPEIHTSFMPNGHSKIPLSAATPDRETVNFLAAPTAVVVQDMGLPANTSDVKFTFSLPVTPPKTPGESTTSQEDVSSLIARLDSQENLLLPPPPGSNNSDDPVVTRRAKTNSGLHRRNAVYGHVHSPAWRNSHVDLTCNSELEKEPIKRKSSSEPNSPVTERRSYLGASNKNEGKTAFLNPLDKMLIDSSRKGDLLKFTEIHRTGANLQAADQYGMTALHHASRFGHKDIVKYMIDKAPHVILDMIDHEKGQTALHKAAWYQRRTICCMLVAAGASLTKTDFQGNTPRLQALKAEDKELASYLESQEQLQLVVSEDQETAV